MLCQVIIKLGTFRHIKAGLGNQVRSKGSQKQTKESETAPFLLLGVPQEHPVTTITFMQRT